MLKYQKQERYQGTTLYSYLHEFSHPIRSILYIFIKRKVQCKLHYQPLMIELQFFRCGKYFFSQINSCHWHLTKHFYKTASPYPIHYLIARAKTLTLGQSLIGMQHYSTRKTHNSSQSNHLLTGARREVYFIV